MDSLALNSVFGLVGHSSKGPRTEAHWPDLGHMTLIPDPVKCNLAAQPGSPAERELGQVSRPGGPRQAGRRFPEENQGVAGRRKG